MPELTDSDRDIIARARRLAAAATADSLRLIAGRDAGDDNAVRVDALGVAQYLLGELADRLEQLGS